MRESRCNSAASIMSRVRDACEQEVLLEAFDTIAIISVTDNNGKIIYANNQFLVISGYSETEVIGQVPGF